MKKQIFFSFCIFIVASLGHADSTIIYHEYFSPNKMFVAQVSIREKDSILIIKNQKSGEIELSITDFCTPILNIQWAPNSASLVVIQHLAGSSLASLLHHSDTGWMQYDCSPPLNLPCKYSIVDIKFLKETVRLTYRISQKRSNGAFINFKLCVLDVSYDTGFILLDSVTSLSEQSGIKALEKARKRWGDGL